MAVFSRIAGTGSALPQKVLTNKDLEQFVETSDEWIASRTGIRQRHRARDDQPTSDLAVEAARRALADAGRAAAEVDLIIVATTTPDMTFPAVASIVQAKLGAGRLRQHRLQRQGQRAAAPSRRHRRRRGPAAGCCRSSSGSVPSAPSGRTCCTCKRVI